MRTSVMWLEPTVYKAPDCVQELTQLSGVWGGKLTVLRMGGQEEIYLSQFF